MKFDIGFLDKLNPKLLKVAARAIDACSIVGFLFVGKQSIDDDLVPFSVFEELERDETTVEVVFFYDQFLEELCFGAHHREGADEPTSAEQTVLGIDFEALSVFVFLADHELGVFDNLLRPFPFQVLEQASPLGQVSGIFIKLGAVHGEVFVDPLLAGVAGEPFEDRGLLVVVLFHGVVFFLLFALVLLLEYFLRRVLHLQF